MSGAPAAKTRMIYVPGIERWVTLKSYLKGMRLAKAHLDDEFKHGLTCWWPCTGREIVRQFVDGMNDRINDAIPCIDRGRDGET